MQSKMPVLPVDDLSADFDDSEKRIVRAAFTSRGGSRLRANKPFKRVTTFEEGCANYVWRMLCFDLVGHGKHACMPVTADFDLHDAIIASDGRIDRDERWQKVQELTNTMDELVKRFERDIPVEQKKGLLRWGRALGLV